ncbi:[LysW]-aminoadipate/[LysW]-glutamate kinase [Candidatus Bathyarchaeota archaeon]|nr:[LysW]-aminoadipate/[LysW]-glutamate kinase [Candidatus Bathyarchaeota archaeon]MBS7613692.1 [LysW]-aminoadipate/[LysW]-glutamate kinase [Candidatus Bathyarchaeota archaeon]MBS7618556.1 [LysW]-aminoadipate/[LysW]-glutamate kinase [Candidatus Bathyarchaeota archaeon]
MVVKIGGSILKDGSPDVNLISDIKEVFSNCKLVLVHGGGDEVTSIASRMGKEQVFVTSPDGFRSRYTDRETLDIYVMVMAGKISKEIVSTLLEFGLPAVGISGVDGGLLRAERKKKLVIIDEKGRKRIIPGGYTGKITDVNIGLLETLLNSGYLPVISPLSIGYEYEILNVDGDRAASYVAGALKADRLILLTDVEGLILDGELCEGISSSQLKEKLRKIGPGMITKVYAAMEALEMGVDKIVICSGLKPKPITSALEGKAGTTIYRG